MNRFEGNTILLTGAGSGIGRATVHRLVSEGAVVFGIDREPAGLAETAEAATGPGRVLTHVADVTDEDQVKAAVQTAATELGRIEALINVAGSHRTTPIEQLTVEDLHQLYDVNLVGTALFCRESVPHLSGAGGVIVNVASSAALHGNPYMTAYSASKGAVVGFSLALAAELIDRRIRVVSVSPGTVATPLTRNVQPGDLDFSYYNRIRSPMGVASPEQIAGTITFAASSDAGYLTGVDLRVDGGSHI